MLPCFMNYDATGHQRVFNVLIQRSPFCWLLLHRWVQLPSKIEPPTQTLALKHPGNHGSVNWLKDALGFKGIQVGKIPM